MTDELLVWVLAGIPKLCKNLLKSPGIQMKMKIISRCTKKQTSEIQGEFRVPKLIGEIENKVAWPMI